MSALDQMKDGATLGGELAISSVGSKLKPILTQRAKDVAKTIADFNKAEDEFIAKKLGASSLAAAESILDVAGFFSTL
jgi:hypothetical protein